MPNFKHLISSMLLAGSSLLANMGDGPHCREADRVIRDFAKRIEEQKGLVLTGFGGQMPHEIRTLGASFCVRQPLDEAAARALYLELVQDFVAAVNRDKAIRPYLADYPITSRQVEIVLSLQDEKGKMRRDGSLCMILNVPEVNKVLYHRFQADRMISSADEALDEALATR
jgi:hypothetical protein